MAFIQQPRESFIERLCDFLSADLTRVLLSLLIILSVLPFSWTQKYCFVFFGVFAVELGIRSVIFRHKLRQHVFNWVELLLLLFDFLATLSFLPVENLWGELRLFRLFRLSRMVLLITYWSPLVKEIWLIIAKQERRYQFVFFGVSVLILSFISAILLSHFQTQGLDLNNDGNLHTNFSFGALLWWSFRQIESADNLLKDPTISLAFFFSIFLTLFGLFLFSFLIGLGTSIVEELVALGKQRRIGMRKHTVICNLSPYNQVLLEELVTYYAKSFRPPKIITLGPSSNRYDYMHHGKLKKIRYRHGQPLSRHDLLKVDADRAVRVILLGNSDDEHSDSEVISQILSVREVSPDCVIYAELFRIDSIAAALQAGGKRVVPIMATRLVGLYLANIIVFPGMEEIYRELLSTQGDEIYTAIYHQGAMTGIPLPKNLLEFSDLLANCHQASGVILLGYLLHDENCPSGFIPILNPLRSEPLPHASASRAAMSSPLQGFLGISSSFAEFKRSIQKLPDFSSSLSDQGLSPNFSTVPLFDLCSGATHLEQLLICGMHDGLVDFCEELILFTHVPQIFLMVPNIDAIASTLRNFVERPQGLIFGNSSKENVPFFFLPSDADKNDFSGVAQIHYPLSSSNKVADHGVIRIMANDWSTEAVLQENPSVGYCLSNMDLVLFTYSPAEKDPDARTSMALLKLLHLLEIKSVTLKPGFRIFCEVQDSEKASLLTRRFGGGNQKVKISVMAAEALRNSFLAQAVFVPGIMDIYAELLSQTGKSLGKMTIAPAKSMDQSVKITFGELLRTLYQRDKFLLIAVEISDYNGVSRWVINPRPGSEWYVFTVGQMVSIFGITSSG